MLRLFTLIIFISEFGFAAAGELKTTFSSVQSQGAISSSLTSSQAQTSNSTEFSLTSPTLASTATLKASVSKSTLDEQSFQIKGLQQSTVMLGLELNKGPHQLQISHSQVVDSSPISSKNYQLSYARSFHTQTSAVGFNLIESDRQQPYQTFIDPRTAVTTARPVTLSAKQQELFYEQIWSENLKGHYQLIFAQRSEDRPDHSGIDIRHSYAFNGQTSLRLDLGYLAENQNQILRDEKGFFSATWSEMILTYQPNLDWTFQAGYGAVLEKEFQPSPLILNSLTQVGTDSYLLKVLYQHSQWQAGLSLKSSLSNTGFKSDSLIGEFAWEI